MLSVHEQGHTETHNNQPELCVCVCVGILLPVVAACARMADGAFHLLSKKEEGKTFMSTALTLHSYSHHGLTVLKTNAGC